MMSFIRTGRLTMADAEFLLAMLWRALEEYRLRSPRIWVHGIPGQSNSASDLCRGKMLILPPHISKPMRVDGEARTARD
jgi:hypothetical protein